MKYILLLFAALAYGQGKDVVVYGQVISNNKDIEIDRNTGIYMWYTTRDGSYSTFPDNINKDGYYTRKLKGAETVTVESNVHDFYAPSVTVPVTGRDSIRIDIYLIPKVYVYTGKQARTDIRIKKIQLITFDSLEYEWTKKINLQKDFGFRYVYMPRPYDHDFVTNIEDYNNIVEGYLTLKDNDWSSKLSVVRDSIVNLEADNYGKKHTINLKRLKVPSFTFLPKMMQEKIRMWQHNNWYKVELKDYTIAYTLNVIRSDKAYGHFELLPKRVSMDYETLLPELIKLLTNSTEVGMDGYPGIMWCRNIAPTDTIGCIAIPYSEDDLFTVAGRASHILKRITGQDFGNVLPNPDKEWLKKLQNRWAYWLLQLQEK